uniref:Nucleoside diphosphate kinase n=1 Tax=Amblyomma maculatum TaxID=34609 RepID=G3MQD9_AMBMU
MVKPDGVQRGLVGEIIQRFERRGYKLVAMKFMQADEKLLQQHYSDLAGRPFFNGLVKFMQSGPVVPMVWEGTNPLESKPGTIRGDLCIQVGRNIVHGSDSLPSAEKEIALWFKESELCSWTPNIEPSVYE